MDLIGLLTSAAGGGVLGILGKLATMWMQTRVDKQQMEQQRAVMAHELDVMRMEVEGRKQVASITGEAQVETAALNALTASYASDKATYSNGIADLPALAKLLLSLVDFARGVTRPAITWGALFIVSMIALLSKDPAQQAEALRALIFASMTSVTWWFADRRDERNSAASAA